MASKTSRKEFIELQKSVQAINRTLKQLIKVTKNIFEVKFYDIKDENGFLICAIGNPAIPLIVGGIINLTLGDGENYDEDEEDYSFWHSYVNVGNHIRPMPFEITAIHRKINNQTGNTVAIEEIDVIIAPVVTRRVLIEKVKINHQNN